MRTVVVLALACFGLGTAADARHLHLRKPRRGFQMRMTPFVIPPGGDREGCEYLVAPNHGPMDVSAFELKVTPGTHHFVAWEYLGKDHDPSHFWSGIRYSPGCVGLGPRDSFGTTGNLFGMLSGRVRLQWRRRPPRAPRDPLREPAPAQLLERPDRLRGRLQLHSRSQGHGPPSRAGLRRRLPADRYPRARRRRAHGRVAHAHRSQHRQHLDT